jgi:hypothetical protein
MAVPTPTSDHYGIQDGPLCSICSEFTLDRVERGFILPPPKELIAPSRTCRLCRFISSGWPRTLNALSVTPSDRLPSLKLCPPSVEVDESYSQGRHERLPTSRMMQISDLILLTDYNLKDLRLNSENEWSILGRLSASIREGTSHLPSLLLLHSIG